MEIFEATGVKNGRLQGRTLYRFVISETERFYQRPCVEEPFRCGIGGGIRAMYCFTPGCPFSF